MTEGEQLKLSLVVEAPDHCSERCSVFAGFVNDLALRVDLQEIEVTNPGPLIDLVKGCRKAVELGGQSAVSASRARDRINSLGAQRGDSSPCILETMAKSHGLMYATGEDPYDGYLDYD
jgi:hypothetical protein